MTQSELERHPDWEIVRNLEVPAINGMMAAPLVSAGSRSLGLVYVSDKEQAISLKTTKRSSRTGADGVNRDRERAVCRGA